MVRPGAAPSLLSYTKLPEDIAQNLVGCDLPCDCPKMMQSFADVDGYQIGGYVAVEAFANVADGLQRFA